MTAELHAPLGATPEDGGTTFRLWSGHAEGVELCLFDADGAEQRLPLVWTPGQVWTVSVPGVGEGQRYGYRVHGPYRPRQGKRFSPAKLLLDPYARRVEGPILLQEEHFAHLDGEGQAGLPGDERDSAPFTPKSLVAQRLAAVEDAERPWTAMTDSVIYELQVKGFTRLHPELPHELRGTYAGLAHPAVVTYLRQLGVTAVELLPVQQQLTRRFLLERGLVDYWGYNTIAFFAPDPRFAATDDPRAELRDAIRTLHAAGIEVLLDVVYNHTGEGDEHGPTVAFRGIDNESYYRLDPADLSRYRNDAGTGNTLDGTHPAVVRLMVDSLRTFADEYGADGFRFDLAAVLGRSRSGEGFSADAPLFAAIAADPLLSRLKLIAEPWDLGPNGYRLGQFPAGWSEWNDRYRGTVRRFWSGVDHGPAELALRMSGSPDLFPEPARGLASSVNFVTSHDGFTLRDLVSYAGKHNEANGEDSSDGEDANDSLNFGVEGDSDDPQIVQPRDLQRRALLATLLVSRGPAMLLAGDELGRTQLGNNNAYGQDNEVSWLDWMPGLRGEPLLRFVRALVAVRRAHPLLRAGVSLLIHEAPLCLLLRADGAEPVSDEMLLVALNSADESAALDLAAGPGGWRVVLDSADPEPIDPNSQPLIAGATYHMRGRSVVVLAGSAGRSP